MANWREIIKENMSMKDLNTFKLETKVKFYAKPNNLGELKNIIKFAKNKNLKIFILGNGSNIIFRKIFYNDLLIIDMKNFNKIHIHEKKLIAQSGVKSSMLLNYCIKNEISGFEFLAGIPGTIGGMIKMNAGAFGNSISEILEEMIVLNIENLNEEILNKQNLDFKYRKVLGLENRIIIKAIFSFKKDERENIKKKIKDFILSRKQRQPSGFSAGSIFKNPENKFAGKLIEECGLKGFTINDAYVSNKHANFIINKGNAKGEDVLKIINVIKKKVLEQTGIELEEEVIIV